ncbi:MAG: alpha/beta hydrolase [Gemmatimonas sp.]|jgi:carboxylesterase|uniref:alpha/beta hydrolase n=1 Tax=Gemmatimonas sp. TaxID=1962908 RepID=UPI00391F2DC5|nr:alpha/beta fold hydrolase [Gemmatimonadota bacterium]
MAAVLLGVLAAASAAAVVGMRRWRAAVRRRFEQADTARRPRTAKGVVIGAEAITLAGANGQAVLVLHGFNDTPQSMAYLCGRLHAAGYTVHAPRLPGHGGSLREMACEARAGAWRAHVAEAYAALRREHQAVYLCGQSMGGALAVLQAAGAADVPAIALLAPFLGMPAAMQRRALLAALSPMPYLRSTGGERSIHDPVARRAALGPGIVTAAALRALRRVALDAEAALGRLRVPVLYVQSRLDNRVSEADGARHFEDIAAQTKKQVWLDGSGHILSADREKDVVADLVYAWFAQHPGPVPTAARRAAGGR